MTTEASFDDYRVEEPYRPFIGAVIRVRGVRHQVSHIARILDGRCRLVACCGVVFHARVQDTLVGAVTCLSCVASDGLARPSGIVPGVAYAIHEDAPAFGRYRGTTIRGVALGADEFLTGDNRIVRRSGRGVVKTWRAFQREAQAAQEQRALNEFEARKARDAFNLLAPRFKELTGLELKYIDYMKSASLSFTMPELSAYIEERLRSKL